jgi:hypothetical protein
MTLGEIAPSIAAVGFIALFFLKLAAVRKRQRVAAADRRKPGQTPE